MSAAITVGQAIDKGIKMIRLGSTGVLSGCILLGGLVAWATDFAIGYGTAIGMASGIIISFFYKAIMTTKWRIWAFSNVNDVHELKIAAINADLIPKEGSWKEKFEIRTPANKQALQNANARFRQPHSLEDDSAVPDETHIHYKAMDIATYFIIISSLIVIYSLAVIVAHGLDAFAVVMFVLGCAGFIGSKMLRPKKKEKVTILILSNEGIQTPTRFDKWEEITAEEVTHETTTYKRGQQRTYYYIEYKVREKQAPRIELDHTDAVPSRVVHLLYVYRQRYEERKRG